VLLGEDPSAPGVHEQRRVPGRQEAHRRGGLRGRQRCTREVEQLAALLVPEPAKRQPLERARERAHAHPGPVGDVGARRRTERTEVAADEVLARILLGELRLRPDPLLGEAVQIGAAPLPCARRRHAHEIDPDPDARNPQAGGGDLRLLPRPVREQAAQAVGRPPERALVAALHAARPRLPLGAHRDHEGPVVAARDDVDRVAHQRRLDERAPLERARQRLALEAGDARPETDVPGRGVLRLQPADLLDGPGQGQAPPLKQQLPREQRPVELAPREHALGHWPDASAGKLAR